MFAMWKPAAKFPVETTDTSVVDLSMIEEWFCRTSDQTTVRVVDLSLIEGCHRRTGNEIYFCQQNM